MNNLKKYGFVASDAEDVNTRIEAIEKKLLMSVIHNVFHILGDYHHQPMVELD